jgi:DNA-binding transcriptional regulator YdaS (Cro superfamily)
MSNKRPLTTEEIRMAARIKAAIAGIPGMTEERIGGELGVSQSAVSHWTGARLPVPARRAAPLAAVLGIADPGEISVAYQELVAGGAAAPQSQSQPMRLDPERMAELATVLDERWKHVPGGFDLRNEDHAAHFVHCYGLYVNMKERPTPENVVRFSAALSTPQGASKDERSKNVPAQGTARPGVRKGTRREA